MSQKMLICSDVNRNKFEVPSDQFSFRPSVYAVIIRENKILLSKQFDDGYDFPGGGIDIGEGIEEALVREIKEETGLEAKIGQIIHCDDDLYQHFRTKKHYHTILLYFTAEIIGGKISTEFFDEHEKNYLEKAEWVDLDKIEDIKFYNPTDNLKLIEMAKQKL